MIFHINTAKDHTSLLTENLFSNIDSGAIQFWIQQPRNVATS